MRSLPERLHEQLERYRAHRSGQNKDWPQSSTALTHEQEVESLVTLARSFKKATPMQVDARFADLLEKRLLRAATQQALSRQKTLKARWSRGNWLAPLKLVTRRTHVVLTGICLLLLCLGVGGLVVKSLPSPPPTAHTKIKQAELAEQAAHIQLLVLASVADPAHASAYRDALAKLNRQIAACAEEAEEVPAGSDGNQAQQDLIQLKADTRQELYHLLLNLALPERVLTTTELGSIGAIVPVVQWAQFTLTPTKNQAIIEIYGNNILPGAHLLIDNQEIMVNGTVQNGEYTLTIPWAAQQSLPQLLGILNADQTAAQTAALTLKDEPDGDDGGGNVRSGDDGGGDTGGHDGSHGGSRSGG